MCEHRKTGTDFGRRKSTYGSSVLTALLIISIFLAYSAPGKAQGGDWDIMAARSKEYTSTDVPRDIPGTGTETSILTIADTGPIVDLNVKLNISHPYDADLDVFLIAPDGTRVELFTDVGFDSANFEDTILDDEASESITDGSGPFAGSYRPEGSLADFKTKDIAGTWTLEVTDDWSTSRAGTLNSWSLIVELEVMEPLSAPVIRLEQSVSGGIYDTVCWEDGEAKQYEEYESNVEVRIPDNGTAASSMAIEDFGMIEDLNVRLDILHGRDSDLDVFLIAPDKTRIQLFTDVGGMGYHFTDTVLDDDAALSITGGSAPFTGTYRPEGKLSDLVGKEICGTWTLEVTDDSAMATGTLNHWSMNVATVDTLHYVECATDAEFTTIVADSGWTAGKSYTFTGLAPNQEYWYRVKARPMETWVQTTQSDFSGDTLTRTQATADGDVILAGTGGDDGLGPQVFVIQEPSFESVSEWYAWWTNPDVFVGTIQGLWATESQRAGCVLYSYNGHYNAGDYGYLWQTVNWSRVDTLRFDYASLYFGGLLKASVLIGDVEVWSADGTDGYITAHRDVTVDVSAFNGNQPLVLKAEALKSGWFDTGILWDNLRTYGPSSHEVSGSVVSPLVSIGEENTWDLLRFNATTPMGTTLTVDVLPATGSLPIGSRRQIPSSSDRPTTIGLSDLAERAIRLRANLSTTNQSVTPLLHDWSITYSDASRQSLWSNVESSPPLPAAGPIITGVVRRNGESDNRAPIGSYNGNTSVLPTQAGGLMNGNLCFSDRTYPWANTSVQLVGAEYVRTFNSDKKSSTVTYTLTTSREATVMITVDARIVNPQQLVDKATISFARVGTFVHTGLRLFIHEDAATNRVQNVFSARFPAGTYVFSAMPSVHNFYVIAAMD